MQNTEKTPSTFLLEKWTQAFYFYDHNQDGVITTADFAAIGEYIAKKTNATEEAAAEMIQGWVERYSILQPDQSRVLDLKAFIHAGKELFKNAGHQIEINRKMSNDIFDGLDINKDGKISLEELAIFYEAFGIHDETLVARVFKHLDKNGNGFIEREELAEDIIRHFTNPDPVEGRAYFISTVVERRMSSE